MTERLARDIPPNVRARADQSMRDRRTRNSEWSTHYIAYQVRGTHLYVVDLAREPAAISISCSCPYFEDRGPCKHIWAVGNLIERDPRWDGSWLADDPTIEYDTDDITLEDELAEELEEAGALVAGAIDAGAADGDGEIGKGPGPGIGGRRGYWASGFQQPAARARKPPKPVDPVTAAAQAAVNRLAELRHQLAATAAGAGLRAPRPIPPADAELVFIIDAPATRAAGVLAVHAATRTIGAHADAAVPAAVPAVAKLPAAKPLRLSPADVLRVADKADRALVALLTTAAQTYYYGGYGPYAGEGGFGGYGGHAGYGARGEPGGPDAGGLFGHRHEPMHVPPSFHAAVLPAMCDTGRALLFVSASDGAYHPLRWDPRPWTFRLSIAPDAEAPFPAYVLTGAFVRGDDRMALDEPAIILGSGFVITKGGFSTRSLGSFGPPHAGDEAGPFAAPLESASGFWWAANLRRHGALRIPLAKADELLADVLTEPGLPPLDVPEELRFDQPDVTPVPVLTLHPDPDRYQSYAATLEFDYDGAIVAHGTADEAIYRPSPRALIRRKRQVEAAAEAELAAHKARLTNMGQGRMHIAVPFKAAPAIVRGLVPQGWRVSVEGRPYRVSGDTAIEVMAGGAGTANVQGVAGPAGGAPIDWFDIGGIVDFGGVAAPLPELLAAVRRGESMVVLPDSSIGVLTDEWLAQYGGLSAFAGAGAGAGGAGGAAGVGAAAQGLRARPSQMGLLDALLASRPSVTWHARAIGVRDRLRGFDGITPADAPSSFVGTLRGYQRLGLGWLRFLQELSIGGCLADDMGLGKTVTVLALLDERRLAKQAAARMPEGADAHATAGRAPRASLVVAPRSLLFNWKREAERFAPALRVAEYHGAGRDDVLESVGDWDLVLTTYGTMRRDAALLAAVPFDYVILDEAQAIKNAATAAAKATRTLSGRHRLALSGTPIENHLGDLWSLFEFLNPGLLGSLQHGLLGRARKGEEGALEVLRRGLRPFILRRTKAQVAPELPARNEDTMLCELEPAERRLYNQLRDHYRQLVLGLVERQGLQRSRFQILEALLRLRQAACHPGLIDPRKHTGSSAKLDALIERLDEARAEGHKALVFSQFTSLLAFVRAALDTRGVPYEYLDGHTRDRERRVTRFQEDAACPIFLVSLKAGGLGLNLTAADYVFLLDPWWNPAVEAQAIDRAHRIGQERPVFAYRLISADTVEEHIVELQARKRQLADAIITADNSGLAGLTREDLELLLG